MTRSDFRNTIDDGFACAPEGCTTLAQAREMGLSKGARAEKSKVTATARFGTSVGYLKDVQPVLDRYCGKCHQGEGSARKKLDLTLRGYEPYLTLVGRPGWGGRTPFQKSYRRDMIWPEPCRSKPTARSIRPPM